MNGYLVFFPYIMLFSIHLITTLGELGHNTNEVLILIGLLAESLMLSELKNGSGLSVTVPISVALLYWTYIYFNLIGFESLDWNTKGPNVKSI